MRSEYVAVIGLLGLSCCIFHAHGQDIIFPGETERPSRFPLNQGQGGPTNPTPDNSDDTMTTTTTTTTPTSVTTTSTSGQNNQNGNTQQQYNKCVDNCRFTSEYNPQCGSDGVTYKNHGALNCVLNCGKPIRNLGRAPCNQYSSTTPASGEILREF